MFFARSPRPIALLIIGGSVMIAAFAIGAAAAIAIVATESAAVGTWLDRPKAWVVPGGLAAALIAVLTFIVARQVLRGNRRLEQQIDMHKRHLDTAIGNMSQGLLMFDASKRLVVCNRRYLDMYGLSAEVVRTGCTLHDLVRHRQETGSFVGDVDAYCAEIVAALAERRTTSAVVETRDGRSIHVVNSPLADGGWVATHEDITKQRQAERERDENRKFLNMILENAPAAIVVKDAETRQFVLVNRSFKGLWDLDRTDVLGKTSHDLFPKAQADLMAARDDLTVQADGTLFFEDDWNLVTLEKGRIFTSKRTAVRGEDGQSKYIVSVIEDVTERRQIQRERDRSKEFLDLLIEHVPAAITVKDARTRRYVLVNQAANELWNFNRSEAIGKTAKELFSNACADIIAARDEETLQAKGPLVLDGHPNFANPDDHRTWSTKRLAIRDDGGEPRYLVAVIEDVTERHQAQMERDRNKDFLEQIISNVPAAIVVKDAKTRKYILTNRAANVLWNFDATEAIGKTSYDLFPKEQADQITEHDEETARSDGPVFFDGHSNLAGPSDGRVLTSRRQAIRGEDGRPRYLISVIEDVTERRRVQQERDRNKEFLDLIIENVPSTIIVKDARDFRYVLINKAGENYFGRPRSELLGKSHGDILPPEAAKYVHALDMRLLGYHGEPLVEEHMISVRPNELRTILTRGMCIRDRDGEPQYLLAVLDDVTQHKKAEARIAYLAYHDALTGLPNRLQFRERLEHELASVRRGRKLALLYLDLDHFKAVNDTLGHSVGDELLQSIAERLRSCLRESDVVARLGGDEFAVLQIGLHEPREAAVFAQRLRDEVIREPYEISGHHVVVDVSIGIALAPNDGTNVDQLLRHADLALYGAKAEGRGGYRYFELAMDARMKTRRTLELDLRRALADNQFELHYQPLVNPARNTVSGCEALLRWRHPERGMIAPAEFIPIAEETGLIVPIGEWVLRQACADAATWPDDIKVAVNLSPVQIKSQGLTLAIASMLADAGLTPQRLELEITESVLMQSNDSNLGVLHLLRELGVRFAMDDFGTGYSSLSYLRSFPFDKIKIDRSFIVDLPRRVDSQKIVQAVVALARGLGMITTAEGVETDQQLAALRAIGCDEIQGFVFSEPKPAGDIMRLFRTPIEVGAQVA